MGVHALLVHPLVSAAVFAMCCVKASLVVFGFLGVVAADPNNAEAFQEMVKTQLLASPKLDKMLEDPERMRETLAKISEQNNMPGFDDVDQLISDLQEGAKSRARSAILKKEKEQQKKEPEKKSKTKESGGKKEKKSKATPDFSGGMPGMEAMQEMMKNPDAMKEAMKNNPTMKA